MYGSILPSTGSQYRTPSSSFSSIPMLTLALCFSSVLHHLFLFPCTTTAAAAPPYVPTDYVLLNCGSSSRATSSDGRVWEGDDSSKFSPRTNAANSSESAAAAHQLSFVDQVPFTTARIFRSQFTYTFPVSAGPKFVRLYFYPSTYSGHDMNQSFFTVAAGDYTLLRNFSASLSVSAADPPADTLIKEFIVTLVDENSVLNITFIPSTNTYAFVNGIEIVSVPSNLYMRGDNNPITMVGGGNPFYFNNNTAIETVYRLNVGGSYVSVNNDSGMFRAWYEDGGYIHGADEGQTPHLNIPIRYTTETPAYSAPEIVYTTARTLGNVSNPLNLTWSFPVDIGFNYLVRLYFCEIALEVTRENQRVFTIFIANQTAEQGVDVIQRSGGRGVPMFIDYVVFVPDVDGQRKWQDLWLALYPASGFKAERADVILNGLEMFKLNQSDGNLAGPNPERIPQANPAAPVEHPEGKSSSKVSSLLVAVIGVVGGLVILCVLCFFAYRRRRRVKDSGETMTKSSWVPFSQTTKSSKTTASPLPSDLCRRFSLVELRSATCDFDDKFVIGSGGFGNVYRGYIENGSVAIKRLTATSQQGAREFQTEINMLSKLRHLHLVSLIGYCDEDGEMILVYDYMARGTLRHHLYKTNNPPLPLQQRLQICMGAARGLHYLHTGATQPIIHRDVKSTNILLDEKWVAKVSDFGLSRLGPADNAQSHVSTHVKGSFGYVDPEYYRRQRLTEKSDVYSFGVVLLEVLCARPSIVPGLPKEQVSLAQWGRHCYRRGTLDQIIDPHLRNEIAPACLRKFGEVADSCLRDCGIERPSMNDVAWSLEFALQLQKSAKCGVGLDPTLPLLRHGDFTTTDEDVFSGSGEHVSSSKSSGASTVSSRADRFKTEAVFSEIMNPRGR